jgi:hypothetical protein
MLCAKNPTANKSAKTMEICVYKRIRALVQSLSVSAMLASMATRIVLRLMPRCQKAFQNCICLIGFHLIGQINADEISLVYFITFSFTSILNYQNLLPRGRALDGRSKGP